MPIERIQARPNKRLHKSSLEVLSITAREQNGLRQAIVGPVGVGFPPRNKALGKHEVNAGRSLVGCGHVCIEVLSLVVAEADLQRSRPLPKVLGSSTPKGTNAVVQPVPQVSHILLLILVPEGQ